MRIFLILFLIFFGNLSNAVAANLPETQSPEVKLQTVISDLQQEINANQSKLNQDPSLLNQMVTEHLLPIIYVNKMAAMTLGPKWRTATAVDQNEFIKQFSLLLTRTYSTALLKMGDYKITVFPLRGDSWKTADYVAISGQLAPAGGGSASSVTYYMEKDNGVWKIYDFALEGVSFVKNFRSQFEQYSDIKTLLTRLDTMNHQANQRQNSASASASS